MHHPAHIAGTMLAQGEGRGCFHFWREDIFDGAHGADQIPPRFSSTPAQNIARLPVRASIQTKEDGAALLGQTEGSLAAILWRGRTLEQSSLMKFAQHPAEIAGVHAELLRDFFSQRLPAGGQLVEHACLAERVRSVEQTLLQCADKAGV